MSQFKRKLSKVSGFSLVELMVVVAIIGTLASIALPKFQAFQAKAKQAEVKTNLSGIYTFQLSYQGENGSYFKSGYFTSAKQTQLFGGGNKRYTYSIVDGSTDANNFVAQGTAASGALGKCQGSSDTWQINQDRVLSQTSNGLVNCGL